MIMNPSIHKGVRKGTGPSSSVNRQKKKVAHDGFRAVSENNAHPILLMCFAFLCFLIQTRRNKKVVYCIMKTAVLAKE